jgi:hypothetical protein
MEQDEVQTAQKATKQNQKFQRATDLTSQLRKKYNKKDPAATEDLRREIAKTCQGMQKHDSEAAIAELALLGFEKRELATIFNDKN